MTQEDNTQKTLASILDALKALDARVARIEVSAQAGVVSPPLPSSPAPARKLSIKEFLLEHAPSDDVQRTLTIGHFLETHEGMSSFNKADLEKGFRAAKEPVPSNINDKVNMSIRNGHMMEADEKKNSMKAWHLTQRGETYLVNGFKKGPPKK
jgi:hypothetical protein